MLIFHHIGKTAGTSLRTILKQNYQPHEFLELYGPNRGSIDWYRNFFQSLSPNQKSAIQCIAAHTAHFMIPVLEEEQQRFQAFCLLRDSVDRAISWYHFARSVANKDSGGSGQVGRLLKQLNWKLEDIYLNLGDGDESTSERHWLFRHFFNGQARTLLAPHVSTKNLSYTKKIDHFHQQKLTTILQNYYVVGTTEHYQQSIEHFAHRFGWKHLICTTENVTPARPKVTELPDEVIALIRAYNSLDTELHQTFL
jgi:hypothetical protein